MNKAATYLEKISNNMDLTTLQEKYPFARKEALQAFFTYNILGEYSNHLSEAVLEKYSNNFWFSGTENYKWKTEALMSIAITKNKKQYAYISTINEYVPQSDKINLKNLEKSNHSPFVIEQQRIFLNMLFETKDKEQLLKKALSHIFKIKDEVIQMVTDGNTPIYSSIKARAKVFYENPRQYQWVINNACQLITKFEVPSESRLLQIPLTTFNTTKGSTGFEKQMIYIEDTSPEFYERLQHAFKEDETFLDSIKPNGLQQIGLPVTEEKVPDYILPLIDKNIVVQRSVINGLKMWLNMLNIDIMSGRIDKITSVNLI